jgi:hypothetical protein
MLGKYKIEINYGNVWRQQKEWQNGGENEE